MSIFLLNSDAIFPFPCTHCDVRDALICRVLKKHIHITTAIGAAIYFKLSSHFKWKFLFKKKLFLLGTSDSYYFGYYNVCVTTIDFLTT